MNVNLKRLLSLLLVILLVAVLPISTMAATIDGRIDETEPTIPTETESAPMEPTETLDTESTEPTVIDLIEEKESPVTEVAEPEATDESQPTTAGVLMAASDDGISTVADAEITGHPIAFATLYLLDGGIDLPTFDHIQHKDHIPLYAVYLRDQPGYANNYYVAYCVEPGVELDYSLNYSGSSFALDDLSETSSVLSRLTLDQLKAMSIALLYGQQEIASRKDEESVRMDKLRRHAATQVIVWEIACGLRNSSPPYERTSTILYDAISPELEISNAVWNTKFKISGIADAYDDIVEQMSHHYTIPSFTSDQLSTAPKNTLSTNTSNQYSITLVDNNSILDDYTFVDTDNVTYNINKNHLTINSSNSLSEDLIVSPTKLIPNLSNQVFYVWENGDGQRLINCKFSPIYEPACCYFKLNTASGTLCILKTTQDGDNLAGWMFGLFADAECTTMISGPHITDESGKIELSLEAGEVFISELGHSDKVIDDKYQCSSINPQQITVVINEITAVFFHNIFTDYLTPAEITIHKINPQGQSLAGAVFLLEWSVDGTNWLPVSSTDSTYVTAGTCTSEGLLDGCLTSPENGLVQFTGLHPERYYRLTEISAPDGYQLLAGAAFEGTIPTAEGTTITITVVNAPVYELPMTGSKSFVVMAVSLCICIAGCVGALVYLHRKEQ